jgi:predicted transcriptional regulator
VAKGINIAIGADTRAFADAVKKGLIDPTEEAAEALQDLGKDGGRDLGRLEDGLRDAQNATEKTTDEVEDLKKQLKDVGDEAKRSVGDKTRKATDDAGEGMKDLKEEGAGTAREVAASFDGSAESIAGGFQEVAANAFAGFGPAGALAGLAAAAGIGLVTAELTKQQEEAEETKQALIDMYKEAIEEGRNYLSEAQILGAVTDIMFDTEKMERYRKEAEQVGVDVETYVRAQAGSYEDLQLVVGAATEAEAERAEEIRVAGRRTQGSLDQEVVAIDKIKTATEGLIEQHQANAQAADTVAAARENSEKRQREQIDRTRATDQARYEAAARSRGALAAAPPVVIPVSFQEPDASAVRNNIQRKLNGLGPVRIDAAVYTKNGTPVF